MAEKRECRHHGLTEFYNSTRKQGKSHFKCKLCNKEAVENRRKRLKELAVEYKGGKCIRCGYSKCIAALEFHHRDETTKEFGIAYKGKTLSFEKLKAELDKCDLLCAVCHREVHFELDNK